MNPITKIRLQSAESRLKRMDQRLAELEVLLERIRPRPATAQPTFKFQELNNEAKELRARRRDLDAEIKKLKNPGHDTTRAMLDHEEFLARREAEIEADYEMTAQKWEAQGDHRQARIWRQFKTGIRQYLEDLHPAPRAR